MDRPLGVVLLASFFFVQSFINIVNVTGYYAGGEPIFSTVYYAIISIAGFISAYGLWKGRKWGRFGMVILSGWEILIGILAFIALSNEGASTAQVITKVMVYAIIIYFLSRPEIAIYFKN
jgi:hypothetical protein